MNELVQKATTALREKGFTELTVRMSYSNDWNPFASNLEEGCPFSKEQLYTYIKSRHGVDMAGINKDIFTKKQ